MKVRRNIGIINALIRITFGFTILSWCTAKLVKKPWRDSYIVMAIIGGMKIGEGILQYCPLTALFERSQMMQKENDGDNPQLDLEDVPYNPT